MSLSSRVCGTTGCGTMQYYNQTTGSCECEQGWGGVGCTACQTDSVCGELVPGLSQGTCSADGNFTEQTAFLSYECDLEVNFGAASHGMHASLVWERKWSRMAGRL